MSVGGDRGGDADSVVSSVVPEVDVNGDDQPSAWPGLESLPPTPPAEYPQRARAPRRGPARRGGTLPAPGSGAERPSDSDAPVAVPPATIRRPQIARVSAIVASVVVLLIVLFTAGRYRADQLEAGAGSTTTTAAKGVSTTTTTSNDPTSSSSSTSLAPLPPMVVPTDPPLLAAVEEVSAFVAEQRGLRFGDPVAGVRLPDAEFESRIRERALRDPRAIEAEGAMLKLQGLLAPDVDYTAMYLAIYPMMVRAYFDPEVKNIVLRGVPGSPITGEMKVTLAHELTHALDFDVFDLASRAYEDPNLEQQFGLEALIEGNGQRIEHRWAQTHDEAISAVSADRYDNLVSSRMAVVYELGEKLVDDIVARGGEADLNKAFDDPPSTSEQIMHPEKYAAREATVALGEPTSEGTPLWRGVIGEYTTREMLRSAVDREVADRSSAGWGADKAVLWVQDPHEGGLTCLRVRYAMDSEADLLELEDAFTSWARADSGRTSRRFTDSLMVTMCVDVPPPPVDARGEGGIA